MKKKILSVRVDVDVTLASPKLTEATKGMFAAALEGLNPSFELIENDEETIADRLLQSVRQEFAQQDLATDTSESTGQKKISDHEFYRMLIGDVEQPKPEDPSEPPRD